VRRRRPRFEVRIERDAWGTYIVIDDIVPETPKERDSDKVVKKPETPPSPQLPFKPDK
jgi:hypothetical protein